jgi:hypothetical protein
MANRIKVDKMDWTCSVHQKMINIYPFLIGKPQETRALEKPERKY